MLPEDDAEPEVPVEALVPVAVEEPDPDIEAPAEDVDEPAEAVPARGVVVPEPLEEPDEPELEEPDEPEPDEPEPEPPVPEELEPPAPNGSTYWSSPALWARAAAGVASTRPRVVREVASRRGLI